MAKLLSNLTNVIHSNLTSILPSLPSFFPSSSPSLLPNSLPSISALPTISSSSNILASNLPDVSNLPTISILPSISSLSDILSSNLPSILPDNWTDIIPHINISNINLPVIEVKGRIDDDSFRLNMMISNDLILLFGFIGLILGAASLYYTCVKKAEYASQPITLNSAFSSPPPERELIEVLNKNSRDDHSQLIANPYYPDDGNAV